MSEKGELGTQLVKWKSIQRQIDACKDTMEKNELKKKEHNCKRTLSVMVKCWSGDQADIVADQSGGKS